MFLFLPPRKRKGKEVTVFGNPNKRDRKEFFFLWLKSTRHCFWDLGVFGTGMGFTSEGNGHEEKTTFWRDETTNKQSLCLVLFLFQQFKYGVLRPFFFFLSLIFKSLDGCDDGK